MHTWVWPMLAVSGGDMWMMSTPFGKRRFFYEENGAWRPAVVASARAGYEWRR